MELVGFEPTSKRGNHTLSTCLFQTLIFVLRQDLDHQPEPYLLKFHHPCGAKNDYFRFACAALPIRFGTTSMERRLVLLPCKRIKPVIYCTSIRQREHTHCCQLIFRQKRLGSLPSTSSACLRTISSCRQIQSSPYSATRQNAGIAAQRYKKIMKHPIILRFCCTFAIILRKRSYI